MTYNNWKLITERVHAHTRRVMIECADSGHGCDHGRALRSAMRLQLMGRPGLWITRYGDDDD